MSPTNQKKDERAATATHAADTRYDYLPKPLREAPRAFDMWSKKQLLAEQNASTPDNPLYHYTNEQALKGILSNEKLWCFGHQYQKDVQEFQYSLDIARRVIKRVGESDDSPTHWFCACLLDMLDNNSFTETFEFYLFSLSRHADDPQQWREYGDAGREFAIGFAPTSPLYFRAAGCSTVGNRPRQVVYAPRRPATPAHIHDPVQISQQRECAPDYRSKYDSWTGTNAPHSGSRYAAGITDAHPDVTNAHKILDI